MKLDWGSLGKVALFTAITGAAGGAFEALKHAQSGEHFDPMSVMLSAISGALLALAGLLKDKPAVKKEESPKAE